MEFHEKDTLSLVKKAIKGNAEAYGTLIVGHQDYLYRVAFLHLKNEDLALDAVSECILQAFQSIRTLKKPEYFKTWLTKILIHCAIDIFRQTMSVAPMDTVQAAAPEPDISSEEKWDLYDAIDVLPERYRTVIILKYFSNMTISEIAYAMNIPEGSVKAYLSRARGELKASLKEDYLYVI